jgi:hypothetical protein
MDHSGEVSVLLRDLASLRAVLTAIEYSLVQQAPSPIIDNLERAISGDRYIVVSALAYAGRRRGSARG